jgi:PEGA domain-containing protein/DnaJ-like protein
MPDRYEQALRVLGLEPGATEQAVKDAYRDLVKVWHPDRFGSDARLREKAQDKLKEVNAAFDELRGYRAADFRSPRQSAHPREPESRVRETPIPSVPVERANPRHRSDELVLVVCAAVIGLVGMGLFLARSRAPEPASPTHELMQTPGSVTPTRAPASRPSARPGPEGSRAGSADVTPRSAAPPQAGSLMVASRPAGACVSFDGRVVGETPITVSDVMPGEHHVELTLDGHGYEPWSAPVVVTAGHEEKLLAVMTPTKRGR